MSGVNARLRESTHSGSGPDGLGPGQRGPHGFPNASSSPASGVMNEVLGLLLTPLPLSHALPLAVLAGSPLPSAHLHSFCPLSTGSLRTATSQGLPFGCNQRTWGFIVVFHHRITDVHPNHCPPTLPGCIREALPHLLFQAGGQGGLRLLLSTEGSPAESRKGLPVLNLL